MGERGRTMRLQALGILAVLAPFNLVGDRSGGILLLPVVAVSLIVGTVVAASGFLDSVSRGWPRRLRVLDGLVGTWLVALWTSTLMSGDIAESAAAAARVSVVIVVILGTAHTARSCDDAAFLFRRVLAGVAAALVIGVFVLVADGEPLGTSRFFGSVTRLGPYERLTRPWPHANVAAMALGASAVTVVAVRNARLRALAAVMIVVGTVLTYSRGGIAALIVGAVVWVALQYRRQAAVPVVVGALVIGSVVAVVLPGWVTRTAGQDDVSWYLVNLEPPPSIELGVDDGFVTLGIENRSTVTWPRDGQEPVIITARWIEPGTDLVWAEHRWKLPRDLAPGDQVEAGLSVERFVPDGRYDVRWDLLIDDQAYFRQFSELRPVVSAGTVTDSPIERPDREDSRIVPLRRFLSRPDIFRAALDAFVDEPIVGIGPGRLASTMDEVEAVGHAHNLLLEPLATWGLFGTLPFLAVFVGAGWQAAVTAIRRRGVIASAVAVGLVIVAGHGLVDWSLVHLGAAMPVGLLVGLAWAPGALDG